MTPPRLSFPVLPGCAPDAADAAAPDLSALLAGLPGAACVDDAAFAAAYEATGDVDRARLKTCIARLHVVYGQAGLWGTGCPGAGDVREGHAVTRWRQGFVSMERATPCAWALVCVDGTWASGPRLLAALLPALFAGVGGVAVLRTGGAGAWPAQVLAALELAGQEVVADVDPAALPGLLDALTVSGGIGGGAGGRAGRLLLLGQHPEELSVHARALGVEVWRDGPVPAIGIVSDASAIGSADCLDVAALRAAHADATFIDVPATPHGAPSTPLAPLTAVACSPAHASAWLDHAGLVLGPGHEWCWMHPGLSPAWFTRRAVALLPVPPSRDLPGMP